MEIIDVEKEKIDKYNELRDKIKNNIELAPYEANFLAYLLKKY